MCEMKGKGFLFLCMAVLLLLSSSACSTAAPEVSSSAAESEASFSALEEEKDTESEASSVPEASAPETDSRTAFYEYLKSTVIPEEGLANLGVLSLNTEEKESGLAGQDGLGLLSADVRDYDGDGAEDMVTFSIAEKKMGDTSLGALMYDGETSCIALEMRLYTMDGSGVVALSDTVNAVAEIEHSSWGPMVAGVQEVDGIPYLYGYCTLEDVATYGASPFTVYHVEKGKFVFDLIDGHIGWGQGSYTGDANAELGTRKLAIVKTPLNDVYNQVNKLRTDGDHAAEENAEVLQKLEGSAAAYVGMYVESYPDTVTSRAADYTYLREILEKGLEAFAAEQALRPTPEPSAEPESEYAEIEASIAGLVGEIEEISGMPLTLVNEEIADGSYSVRYEAAERTGVQVVYSTESGAPTRIGVFANGGDVTEEWLALKDAVLTAPSLGFNADDAAAFLGDCGFQHGSPVDIGGGASVLVANAGTCTMLLQWL